MNAGIYTVRISDSCSTVTSPPAFLTLYFIFGNNASVGEFEVMEKFDRDAGGLLQSYTVSPGDGRGVVVVGNILYSTVVGDSHIYKTDVITGDPLGSIPTVIPSMATLAWDGSHFWTTDYAHQNKAYELDAAGNLVKTITLPLSEGDSDGMEWFNKKLIVNRGDAVGVYDIYDLDGNVLVANFIEHRHFEHGHRLRWAELLYIRYLGPTPKCVGRRRRRLYQVYSAYRWGQQFALH